MNWATTIPLILVLLIQNAFADRGFALKAIGHANGSLITSPPLPNLFSKAKAWDLTFRPAAFESSGTEGDQGADSSFSGTVDFSGQGLAILYSSYWTKEFGPFILFNGAQLEGEFSSTANGLQTYAKDVTSSMYLVSTGFSFRMSNISFLPIQIFAGPSLTKTQIEQKITSSEGDDFDMTLAPTTAGYLVGAQLALKLGKWVAINPYFMMTDFINSNDRCQTFETTVRSNGPLFDLSDTKCQEGENSSTSKIEYDTSFSAYGINVLFPVIGLSINVMAETGDIEGFEGAELEMFYISITL